MCSSEIQISTSTFPCPLCCQPNFPSVDSLRTSLISVTNRPLNCPVCQEILLGLDKLTIHLFSHSIHQTNDEQKQQDVNYQQSNARANREQQQQLPHEQSQQESMGLCQPPSIPSAPYSVHCQQQTPLSQCQSQQHFSLHTNFNATIVPTQTELCDTNKQYSATTQPQQQAPETPLKAIRLRRRRIKPIKVEPGTVYFNQNLYTAATDQVPQCHVCGFTFRTLELQQMHMRLVHEIFPDTLAAVLSDSNTTNNNYLGQISGILINGNRFQCHLCTKYFKMKGSLRLHLRVVHGVLATTAASQHQSTSTVNPLNAALATMTSAGNLPSVSAFNASINPDPCGNETNDCLAIETAALSLSTASLSSTSSLSPTNGSVNAGIEATTTPDNLLNVKIENQPNEMNNSNENNNLNDGNSSENSSLNADTRLWDCDVCGKNFTTKYFLKKHKRLHTGEMPYTCNICYKTFTFQQSYHKHLLYHSDDKPHTCTICGRAFKELSTLHNHERIHSGEKPFKCETCDKSFRQRVSYLVHRRIHTGVMPYKCPACDKSFRYKVSQRTHKCSAIQMQGTEIQELNELVLQSSPKEVKSPPIKGIDALPNETQTLPETILQLPLSLEASLQSSISPSPPKPPDTTTNSVNLFITPENYTRTPNTHPNDSSIHTLDSNLPIFNTNQSLDDFVTESYNKMGIDDQIDHNIAMLFGETSDNGLSNEGNVSHDVSSSHRIPSPSEKFQNLCLYSDPPQTLNAAGAAATTTSTNTINAFIPPLTLSPSSATQLFNETLETINEESFKQLLYGHSDDNLI